jgi:hypothetical protein
MPYYPPIGDIKGAPARSDVATHTEPTDPFAGATDPEFKYVNVRRLSAVDDDAAGPSDLAVDDGTGTQAAFDKFLEIDGIDGETADTAHASGGGGGAGKVSYSDLSVMMAVDDGTVGALEADAPSGTGKTLSASLLGRGATEAESGGTGLVADVDPAALNHGVSVLAWARVDGVSPLDTATPGAGGGGPHVKVLDGSTDAAAFDLPVDGFSWSATMDAAPYGATFNGGVTVAAGNAASAAGNGDLLLWRNNYGQTSDVGSGDRMPGDLAGEPISVAGGDVGEDLLIGGITSFGDAEDRSLPGEQLALNYSKVDWSSDATPDGGGILLGMGDGSVRFVSDGVDPF